MLSSSCNLSINISVFLFKICVERFIINFLSKLRKNHDFTDVYLNKLKTLAFSSEILYNFSDEMRWYYENFLSDGN